MKLLDQLVGDIDTIDFKTEEELERLKIFKSLSTKFYWAMQPKTTKGDQNGH